MRSTFGFVLVMKYRYAKEAFDILKQTFPLQPDQKLNKLNFLKGFFSSSLQLR